MNDENREDGFDVDKLISESIGKPTANRTFNNEDLTVLVAARDLNYYLPIPGTSVQVFLSQSGEVTRVQAPTGGYIFKIPIGVGVESTWFGRTVQSALDLQFPDLDGFSYVYFSHGRPEWSPNIDVEDLCFRVPSGFRGKLGDEFEEIYQEAGKLALLISAPFARDPAVESARCLAWDKLPDLIRRGNQIAYDFWKTPEA